MSEKKKNEAKCEKQKEVQALDDAALESAAGGCRYPAPDSVRKNNLAWGGIFKPDYKKKYKPINANYD